MAAPEFHYTFRGEAASKKNSRRLVHARGRTILLPSAAYGKWEKVAKLAILKSGRPREPLKGATVAIRIYHGDMVRRDSNNATQGVQDVLVEMGVLSDDNWMVIGSPTVEHFIDVEDPRMEVTVTEKTDIIDYKEAFAKARRAKRNATKNEQA